MAWPTLQEYNEAIQNPPFAFDGSELKTGKPELNSLGLPRAITGQFASVYRLQCGQRDYAVRCFSQEIKDHQERYAAISQHLHTTGFPYMVHFDYLSKGIKVLGQWYPILKMEWVYGETLPSYIQSHVQDSDVLRQLAMRWVKMVKTLQACSIAHGDLQHGNILVVNGDFKLVDYDGMYVPALAGRASSELGHRNYQHPRRTRSDFGPYLDNFSAWVIFLALATLSVDPSLRAQVKVGDEHLLLRKEDFDQPLLSPVFTRLERHSDPQIRSLAMLFRSLIYLDPKQIPSLDGQVPLELASSAQAGTLKAGWVSDFAGNVVKGAATQSVHASQAMQPAPNVSWVFDFMPSSEKADVPVFGRYIKFLRGSAIIAVVTMILAIGFAIVATISFPSVFAYNLLGSLLPLLLALTFVGGQLIFNLFAVDWCYRREPPVVGKRSLRVKEKQERKALEELQTQVTTNEKRKAVLRNEENQQSKQINEALARLQIQEQNDKAQVQATLNNALASIATRRTSLDQEERNAAARLQTTIGARVDTLKKQIADFAQAESKEINDRLQKIQSEYIETYLKRFNITEAPLVGLQYTPRSALVTALISAGINTAYDISYARVDAVRGFARKRTQRLVDWRYNLEQKARRQMPQDLSLDEKRAIRGRYEAQRRVWESELGQEQAHFSAEERDIKERYKRERQSLDNAQAAVQAQANQELQKIAAQYAQEYVVPTQNLAKLTAEFEKKRQEIDEQTSQVRKKMFEHTWQLAKIRREQGAYKNVTFEKYLATVYLGRRST